MRWMYKQQAPSPLLSGTRPPRRLEMVSCPGGGGNTGTKGAVATELARIPMMRGPPGAPEGREVTAEIVAKGLSADVCGRRKSRTTREAEPPEVRQAVGDRADSATPGDNSPRGRIFT